jgi:hypothetical protein
MSEMSVLIGGTKGAGGPRRPNTAIAPGGGAAAPPRSDAGDAMVMSQQQLGGDPFDFDEEMGR